MRACSWTLRFKVYLHHNLFVLISPRQICGSPASLTEMEIWVSSIWGDEALPSGRHSSSSMPPSSGCHEFRWSMRSTEWCICSMYSNTSSSKIGYKLLIISATSVHLAQLQTILPPAFLNPLPLNLLFSPTSFVAILIFRWWWRHCNKTPRLVSEALMIDISDPCHQMYLLVL